MVCPNRIMGKYFGIMSIRIKKELVDSYLREGWKLGAVYEWTAHKDVMEQ